MGNLEPNSRDGCGLSHGRGLKPGRAFHSGGDVLQRHRHEFAFAAVVLAGKYAEAGDTGLHHVEAGHVILHQPYEAHLDRFHSSGAEVLTIELPADFCASPVRRIEDPDAIVRLTERDPLAAPQLLLETSVAVTLQPKDWPELLVNDLTTAPDLALSDWARRRGLHPGSVSRGFRQQFGITAAAFRASIRASRALRALLATEERLADVAASHGFADQSHMTRAIRTIVGSGPAKFRRRRHSQR